MKILMEDGKPVGGKYSFDVENRLLWRGEPQPPVPPTFPRDPIKEEVGRLIRDHFPHHPGRLDLDRLPATKEDAKHLWSWAKIECLPLFGPYEDAMSSKSRNLFHTRISNLLNIHRLTPAQVLYDTIDLDLPLASKEGFIRQVLGWREFMYHVHRLTDGFRDTLKGRASVHRYPGDGGYARWSGRSWEIPEGGDELDGGAEPSALESHTPLASLRKRGPARVKKDAAIFRKVKDILMGGGRVTTEDLL